MHTVQFLLLVIVSVTIHRTLCDPVDVIDETAHCVIRFGTDGATGTGVHNRTFNDVPYCAFLGIRYVKPPVGELRFADPVQQDPKGHHNYTVYGSTCPQYENINKQRNVQGEEDCLFLNVFAPLPKEVIENAVHPTKYPVLVFIHGGSFVAGSGEVHGVDLLMENELIVVTVNYRLGVFGFLKNERQNITGNYGLKDQLAALRWVRRHVQYFGGDPERVTLMGHSAGAGAVSNHLYHEQAGGLFQSAIVLSGSLLAPWSLLYDHRQCIGNYLRDLSATTLSEIRELNYRKFFIRDALLRHSFAFCSMFYTCFIPTLEDHPEDQSAYFHKAPHQLVRERSPPQIPILISETSTEFQFLLPHVSDFWMSNNYPNNRHLEVKRQVAEILDRISNWALERGLVASKKFFYRDMSNMANLYYPTKRLLRELAQSLDQDLLYYMRFEFDGKFGEYKKKTYAQYMTEATYGAVHGDELGYIFSPYNLRDALANRTEYRQELSVHIRTVELIANFVKYGNPTPKRSKLSGLVWPVYSEANNQTQYLNVDDDFTLCHVDDSHNLFYMIWQIVYECLYYSSCNVLTKLEKISEMYGTTSIREYDYEGEENEE